MAGLTWHWTPYMLPGALGAALALGLLAWVRSRRAPGASWFAIMLAGVAGWCATQVICVGVMPVEAKLVAFKLQYVAILAVSPAFLLFAASYTGQLRLATPAAVAVLFSLQGLTLGIVVTNDAHGLVWRDVALRRVGSLYGTSIEYGPWFWVHTTYQYALVLAGVGMLLWMLGQHQRRFSPQTLAVAASPLVVLAPNLYFIVKGQTFNLDPTPAAFGVAGALVAVALLRFGLLDLVPVARTALVESMSEPVFVVDGEGRLIDCNPTGEGLLGIPAAAALGRPLAELALWCVTGEEGSEPWQVESGADGERRTWEATATAFGTAGDLSDGHLIVLRDVTMRVERERELHAARAALEAANERLARQASIDDLTGLANRRAFMERLGEEAARARRANAWLAVVMLDLDHFKRINDEHGHGTGDQVLRLVGAALQATTRASDVVARVGGEELAVMLPDTDLEGAERAAARLRTSLDMTAADAELSGRDIRVTASVGVAAARGEAIDVAALLHLADERLYRAKESGRNQIQAG